VVDSQTPLGVESKEDKKQRKDFFCEKMDISYKKIEEKI